MSQQRADAAVTDFAHVMQFYCVWHIPDHSVNSLESNSKKVFIGKKNKSNFWL